MANTNSRFYTNKELAMICNVSEASMTNLIKSLELTPVKVGGYGRKYYNNDVLRQVKAHYKAKTKSATKPSTKDDIIEQQQSHIEDLRSQIDILTQQLAVKDSQIETQNEQLKQNAQLLSQAHVLTLQAQKSNDGEMYMKGQNGPETAKNNNEGHRFWSRWSSGKE